MANADEARRRLRERIEHTIDQLINRAYEEVEARGELPPRRSGPPRPADGIKATSRKGQIGETWWSRRFVEVLEGFGLASRLARGRTYARKGQVLELDVQPGTVRARVQGTRKRPYEVSISVRELSGREWGRVEDALASRAVFLARLLAGEMPTDIEDAFSSTKLTLFPSRRADLSSSCSCPDHASPCKHVAAVYYLLAEAFDLDPFLIFRWRGRDRETLIERLRARRGSAPASSAAPEGPPDEDDPASFWSARVSLDSLRVRPVAPAVPDALLKELGPLGIDVRGRPLEEILAALYAEMTAGAERLALR